MVYKRQTFFKFTLKKSELRRVTMKILLVIFGVIIVLAEAFSEDKNYFFSYPLKVIY